MSRRLAAGAIALALARLLAAAPAGAAEIDVDIQNPAAADGNPGTASLPLKTIAAAASRAVAGDTVLVRAGTYREVLKPVHSGEAGRPITFRAQGEVWLKGSDVVTGWRKVGDDWVHSPWQKRHWYDASLDAASKAPFASSARQDQVFCQGLPLQWVPDTTHLAANSFCWAADGSELRLRLPDGTDPNQALIEVPMRAMVIGAWPELDTPRGQSEVDRWRASGKAVPAAVDVVDHIVIQGFHCAHNAATVNRAGVRIQGLDWVLEDNSVEWMNAIGIGIDSDDAVLRRNHTEHNGQLGMGGSASRVLLEDNTTSSDNERDFDVSGSGGGLKITDAHEWTIRRQLSVDEAGPGIWCDIECSGITIDGCTVLGNRPGPAGGSMGGIFYEISYGPCHIQDCLVIGNHAGGNVGVYGSGITISSSMDVALKDNLLAFCDGGIGLKGGVRHPDHATGALFAQHGLDHYELRQVHIQGTDILGAATSAVYLDDPRGLDAVEASDLTLSQTTIIASHADPDLHWAGRWESEASLSVPARLAQGLRAYPDLAQAMRQDPTIRSRYERRLGLLLQAIAKLDPDPAFDPSRFHLLGAAALADHAQVLIGRMGERTCAILDCTVATTVSFGGGVGTLEWDLPGHGWSPVELSGGGERTWAVRPGVHLLLGSADLALR